MDTDEVLRLLRDVASEVIEPRFRALSKDQVAEKNPGDLVTIADHEAEAMIIRTLSGAYPEAVILGEETSAEDPGLLDRFGRAEHSFTVDPLDGTKNFVAGSPDHAVMVAELRRGDVIRSWIWQPQHRLGYVAERGAGAWRNGERLTRSPADEPPRVVTSRRLWVGHSIGTLPPLELTWVCCGVDYPHLLEGDADAVLYRPAMPWDHAPGSLLVTEAGGWLGGMDGADYRPGISSTGVIAAADHATYRRLVGLTEGLPWT
jgi:fructose-1,6-bisphosphatase/inositol monophosphatase family enzyme